MVPNEINYFFLKSIHTKVMDATCYEHWIPLSAHDALIDVLRIKRVVQMLFIKAFINSLRPTDEYMRN